jgi:dipeptidyl aminopeptidase/acylaminoacyl peptidase
VLSPDGHTLAFLSNRSGNEEVWLLDVASGATRQLTHFDGPKLQDLAWSPDSQMLLTSVPEAGQFDITLIDKRSGATKLVAATASDERHGAFTGDGRAVLFVRRSGSKFALRRYNFVSGDESAVLPSVMRLVPSERAGPVVFTRPFEDGVWIGGGREGPPRKLVPFPDMTRMRDILVANDTIWTVRPDGKKTRLVSVDPRTGARHAFRTLPDIARPSGIAIVGDAVVYARSLRLEADLYALRVKD